MAKKLEDLKPALPSPGGVDGWDVMDRFVQQLQGCGRASGQFRLLLEAMKDSTRADAVFLYSDAAGEPPEIVGKRCLHPAWCRELTRVLLAQRTGQASHVLASNCLGLEIQAPRPTSAAMVLVSKSKNAWAVALSFSDRVLEPADVKTMLLARRLLSYHYQQLFAAEDLKDTLFGLIYCLTASIDAKDPYTSGHSERVARIAVRLAQHMGMSESAVSDIYLAGLLHDIGKIGIKDRVLQKPARLTEEEMRHVQEHPVIGDRIISNVKRLAHLRAGVRNHHERFDGSGYPDGLAGEDIPLAARILAVADSCDAMMSPRPYRRAMPMRQIEVLLVAGAGTQWDPRIIEHFMACRGDLYSICQQGTGESLDAAVENALRTGKPESADFGAAVAMAAASGQ